MVHGLAVHKEGLVSAQSDKGAIDMWHACSDKPLQSCPVPEKLSALTASHDGLYAAAGSHSGKLYLWEVRGLKVNPIRLLEFHV